MLRLALALGVGELWELLKRTPDKAVGLDGWAPRHWTKGLSRKAVVWLAVLFSKSENGAPWPTALKMAKAEGGGEAPPQILSVHTKANFGGLTIVICDFPLELVDSFCLTPFDGMPEHLEALVRVRVRVSVRVGARISEG